MPDASSGFSVELGSQRFIGLPHLVHENDNDHSARQLSTYAYDRSSDESASRSLIDFRVIGAALARRKLALSIAVMIVLAAVMAVFAFSDKRYDAISLIGLERKPEQVVDTPGNANSDPLLDMPSVDTEVTILLSPSVVRSAVENSKLNEDEGFVFAATSGEKEAPISVNEATNLIISKLTAQRQGASYVIEAIYSSRDPQVSAKVANAVVEAYINRQVASSESGRTADISVLEKRLDTLRGDVLEAESAVARYKAANSLVTIGNEGTAVQDEIGNLNTQLADARAELAVAQGQARANSSDSGSMVGGSEIVRNLRLEAARLSAEYAKLSERYGPNHPERLRIESELASIRSDLVRETARTQQGIANDVDVARNRVAALQSALNRAEGRLVSGSNASVRLNELERVAQSTRDLYQVFLERYRSEMATVGTDKSRAYVISKAATPTFPSSPNPILFALIALLGSVAVGGGTVVILESREKGVLVREEAERHFGVPVIAAIPDLTTVKDVPFKGGDTFDIVSYVLQNDGSVFNEAFRAIRTAFRVGQPKPIAKTLVITSTTSEEGKTTTAICLARTSAMAGIKTLLIDADTRRTATSRTLSSSSEVGLLDVLDDPASLNDALLHDEQSGMYLLPQKLRQTPNFDALQSTRMQQLLDHLKEVFDFIVIDTAPVLPVAETKALAAMADATLLVVRWRRTPIKYIRMTIQQLLRADAMLFGTVMTQVNLRATSMLRDDEIYYESYYQPFSE